MNLLKTIAMMASSDYRERFRAEYYQVEERAARLEALLTAWDEGKLGFEPKTDRYTLHHQLSCMREYMEVLEKRASLEGIELDRED